VRARGNRMTPPAGPTSNTGSRPPNKQTNKQTNEQTNKQTNSEGRGRDPSVPVGEVGRKQGDHPF